MNLQDLALACTLEIRRQPDDDNVAPTPILTGIYMHRHVIGQLPQLAIYQLLLNSMRSHCFEKSEQNQSSPLFVFLTMPYGNCPYRCHVHREPDWLSRLFAGDQGLGFSPAPSKDIYVYLHLQTSEVDLSCWNSLFICQSLLHRAVNFRGSSCSERESLVLNSHCPPKIMAESSR